MWNRSTGCPTHGFSLIVCRHPITKKWLAVEEIKERGWWLPGGFVECGDDYITTAYKECQEEAAIDITIQGILRIEHQMNNKNDGARMRVIFYAEPKNISQEPKQVPDEESISAAWLSLEELQEKSKLQPPDGLRGHELLDWATYIENGGTIYPMDIFATEHTPVPLPGGIGTTTDDNDDVGPSNLSQQQGNPNSDDQDNNKNAMWLAALRSSSPEP